MRYLSYLKERLWSVIWLFFWLFTVDTFLMTLKGSLWLGVYIDITAVVSFFLVKWIEFHKYSRYFAELEKMTEELDKTFLLPEMMDKGHTQEEKAFYSIAKDMEKSMTEHVNSYKFSNREYKEYIEMWIHEVKIPIATAKLVLENHKSDYSVSLDEEIRKIENYTEQALFYARSNYVEKDYRISSISLQETVHQVLLRNKRELIVHHVQLNLHDLDVKILSDGKWLTFLLGQILSNSIKYTGDAVLSIEMYAKKNNEAVELHIKDNGIGIARKDLPRVFEKGFTGSNGRGNTKSTGIGLYLCKKLCERLKHKITIDSDGFSGCEVTIGFPKTSYYDMFS